jgi:polar amino acid transport system substrate-binding protein
MTAPKRRQRLRRLVPGLLAAGALALALAGAGCGGGGTDGANLLERGREDGITLGIADERPYGYQDPATDSATGQAPTVTREVLRRLGIDRVDSAVVEFGALINGLNAGRFDMISAGMFITGPRASQALFSDPDYCATTAFAVPTGNPDGLTDFAGVAEGSIRLGVLSGAAEDGYAVDSGVPENRISRFDTTADMVDALKARRIGAFALTAVTVRAQTADLPGFEATPGFVPVIGGERQLGCGGYVFRFEDKDFRDEFNRVLHGMKQAGEILPLVEPFGFGPAEIDPAKDLTVADLIGKPYDFAIDGHD